MVSKIQQQISFNQKAYLRMIINKIMRRLQILSFLFILVVIQAQVRQIPSTGGVLRADLSIATFADCYEGAVDVNINKGEYSSMIYFACFVARPNDCAYKYCGNGWIANYTTSDGVTQGYPKNEQYRPVFNFKINSAADFVIKKDGSLGQDFDRLIDIAVSQFDPTAASPRTSSTTGKTTQSNFRAPQTDQYTDYDFINGDRIDYSTEEQRTYIPEFSFSSLLGDNTKTLYYGFAPVQTLALSGLESDGATLSRSLQYDSQNKIVVQRSDKVQVALSNSYFQQTDGNGIFNGLIDLELVKRGRQAYSDSRLQSAIDSIKTVYSREDLQARRTQISVINLGGVVETDSFDTSRPEESQSKVFDLSSRLAQESSLTSIRSDVSGINTLGRGRLLQTTNIFTKEIIMFEKTVLGKTIKVSFLVVADIDSTKQILTVTGTIKFNFFGKTKNIEVFKRSQNVNFNWSFSKTISGSWSFNIYIPLPPPVSFLGINFSFTASYSIDVNLNANGVASATFYTCTFTANAGTAIGVDASAALRAVVVEGGVFIKGTLVSLRTDPKVILKYKYAQKLLELTVVWKFYLRAFSFKWGFFWRYWRFFKGWSQKQIIPPEYTISNGVEKTFTALDLFKTYQL